tara:strand:- start:1139 stop:2302 length:1164 start_codon:yes stop_codon:yes gene_type:complete
MSNLLKEAIIDAQALKEAALKNAEAAIIDKYSDEVKQTIEHLLEQDELAADLGAGLGGMPDLAPPAEAPEPSRDLTDDRIPLAATDNLGDEEGKNLEDMPEEGEEVEFNVNLGALQEAIQELKGEMDASEEIELTEEDLTALLSGETLEETAKPDFLDLDDDGDTDEPMTQAAEDAEEAEELDEDDSSVIDTAANKPFEINEDELVDAIMEKLTVDMSAQLAGWAGRSAESTKYEMEKELSRRRSTDQLEDLEPLRKAAEELTFENKQLKQQVLQYKEALGELKSTLVETNLSNARLLYTNRVLRNISLNERQKERIVESISNAGSVAEAKTIYDTLQSTVAAAPKRSPQSLSEAITRRSSVIRATRQESTSSDPHLDRMKKLAGIK